MTLRSDEENQSDWGEGGRTEYAWRLWKAKSIVHGEDLMKAVMAGVKREKMRIGKCRDETQQEHNKNLNVGGIDQGVSITSCFAWNI